MLPHGRIGKDIGGLGSYNTRGHPAYLCRDNKSVQQQCWRGGPLKHWVQ